MKWFGEQWPRPDWPAPVCEDRADQVDAPIGEPCLYCSEAIEPGDSGVVTPCALSQTEVVIQPAHKECFIREVVGPLAHLDRRCSCFGGSDHDTPGFTARQEAIAVYERTLRGDDFV